MFHGSEIDSTVYQVIAPGPQTAWKHSTLSHLRERSPTQVALCPVWQFCPLLVVLRSTYGGWWVEFAACSYHLQFISIGWTILRCSYNDMVANSPPHAPPRSASHQLTSHTLTGGCKNPAICKGEKHFLASGRQVILPVSQPVLAACASCYAPDEWRGTHSQNCQRATESSDRHAYVRTYVRADVCMYVGRLVCTVQLCV